MDFNASALMLIALSVTLVNSIQTLYFKRLQNHWSVRASFILQRFHNYIYKLLNVIVLLLQITLKFVNGHVIQ